MVFRPFVAFHLSLGEGFVAGGVQPHRGMPMNRRDIAYGFVGVLFQETKIRLMVRLCLKHIRPAIAALPRMMRKTRYNHTSYTPHAP